MNRWRVVRCQCDECPEWHVHDPDNEFQGSYDTLPEAHTYATRMSRTVTVELPRTEACWASECHPDDNPFFVVRRGVWTDIYDDNGDWVTLGPADLEQVGTYLLALAKGQQ